MRQLLPSWGSISIDGQDIYGLSDSVDNVFKSFGFCPQTNALFDTHTTREMLAFYATIRGIVPEKRDAYVEHWISGAKLTANANTPCGKLSGGNKRKLCLAIAIMGNPDLTVLDEPSAGKLSLPCIQIARGYSHGYVLFLFCCCCCCFNSFKIERVNITILLISFGILPGVDPAARKQLHRVINAVKLQGTTVLLTTHHMGEAAKLGDRVAIMVSGFLACLGSPGKVAVHGGDSEISSLNP